MKLPVYDKTQGLYWKKISINQQSAVLPFARKKVKGCIVNSLFLEKTKAYKTYAWHTWLLLSSEVLAGFHSTNMYHVIASPRSDINSVKYAICIYRSTRDFSRFALDIR